MELIYDRTEADVLLRNAKGQYNAEDLNRVEQAVGELILLATQLDMDISLTVKTDWAIPGAFSASRWPTESQMQRYLCNVVALCDAFTLPHSGVPDTMRKLTWEGANAIEEALWSVHERIQGILQTYQYSGELFAGEET